MAGYIRLGSLALEPMTLKPGPNKVKANGYILLPSPPKDEQDVTSYQYRCYKQGQESISKILQNQVLEACAIATKHDSNSGASSTGWLADAFEETRIDARIPPLGEKVRLLDGAELRVEGAESAPTTPLIQQK